MFSPRKIWLHPRVAARVLGDYEDKVLADKSDINNLLSERDNWKARHTAAVAETARLETKLAELHGEATRLKEKNALLEAARTALADTTQSLEEEIRTIESRCKELQTEITNRDEEILSLRNELLQRKDTETQIGEFTKTLDRVDEMKRNYEKRIRRLRQLVTDLRNPKPSTGSRKTPSPPPDDDNWLRSLPD